MSCQIYLTDVKEMYKLFIATTRDQTVSFKKHVCFLVYGVLPVFADNQFILIFNGHQHCSITFGFTE